MRAKPFKVGARQQGEQPVGAGARTAATRGCMICHMADFLDGRCAAERALHLFISRVSNLFSCRR
jgi:CxxC motif-containing protein (DUF1111 family)